MEAAVRVDTSGAAARCPSWRSPRPSGGCLLGALVELISTDRGLEADLPAWCEATGHTLIRMERRGASYVGWVRKAGGQSEIHGP